MISNDHETGIQATYLIVCRKSQNIEKSCTDLCAGFLLISQITPHLLRQVCTVISQTTDILNKLKGLCSFVIVRACWSPQWELEKANEMSLGCLVRIFE